MNNDPDISGLPLQTQFEYRKQVTAWQHMSDEQKEAHFKTVMVAFMLCQLHAKNLMKNALPQGNEHW